MAGTGYGFDTPPRPSHDGALRCMVCSDADPAANPDWCPIVERLICDSCCSAIPDGDSEFLDTIAVLTGRTLCPQAVSDACDRCGRGEALATSDPHAIFEGEGGIC